MFDSRSCHRYFRRYQLSATYEPTGEGKSSQRRVLEAGRLRGEAGMRGAGRVPADVVERDCMMPEIRKWRIFYVSDDTSATITADRFVEVGDWIDFLQSDGVVVRRERASGIARIVAKQQRSDIPQ
jgi:hypothetical protein